MTVFEDSKQESTLKTVSGAGVVLEVECTVMRSSTRRVSRLQVSDIEGRESVVRITESDWCICIRKSLGRWFAIEDVSAGLE